MHYFNILFLFKRSNINICLSGIIICCGLLYSCKDKKPPAGKEIVNIPQQMNGKVKELLNDYLSYVVSKNGNLDDSTLLNQSALILSFYNQKKFSPIWSSEQKWLPKGDSLLNFIENSKQYGLFPNDYHSGSLLNIKTLFSNDSLMKDQRRDAALWARADLLLSDALVNIIKDIKLGRLPQDSITLRKDSVLSEEFITTKFNSIAAGLPIDSVMSTLEPQIKGYKELKAGIKKFLENADFLPVSQIVFPNKNQAELKSAVVQRLLQIGYLDSTFIQSDSLKLAASLKKYQTDKRLTVDGKIGSQTIRDLNLSDEEKFKRIAITLDRYKMLDEKMPGKYIWVNLPSFNLKFISNDSVIISSRVVVGKQKTRTPVLTSSVSEIITYPQWNIPQSIIVKEILPALKKDPGYLARKGYGLFDSKGEEVDPYSVDWSKYSKGIPYRVIQGSGDDNALGNLKFNFSNKYAVYLHDTNQRYYFGLDSRALSHGCVRVQEWEKLAFYILNQENEFAKAKNKELISLDSVKHWLAKKEKHTILLKNKFPIFIRYFTCEGKDDKINFYEDIYDEDRNIGNNLFTNKK